MNEIVDTIATNEETLRWRGMLDSLRGEHNSMLTDLERLVYLLEVGAQPENPSNSEDGAGTAGIRRGRKPHG